MAVTLSYVSLSDFSDVMTETEQAEASDDTYGEDGTLSGSGPTRDDEMVKRFLLRAENMSETYLATRYDLPISDPTPMLKYTIMIIARYLLDERGDGAVSEDITQSYDVAIDWLEQVRDHKAELGGENSEAVEDYYGDRVGGVFGEGPYNDSAATIASETLS